MAANSENEWNVGSSNYTSNTKLSGENQFQEKESWVGFIKNVTAVGFWPRELRWHSRPNTTHDDGS
jgi:hypothetical protein